MRAKFRHVWLLTERISGTQIRLPDLQSVWVNDDNEINGSLPLHLNLNGAMDILDATDDVLCLMYSVALTCSTVM